MSAELPLLTVAVARLADPKVHLAALGGVIFPLALLVESPIIMLLAASTALCRDRSSYRWLRRRMHLMGFVLTLLHVVLAFTPLYDLVADSLLGLPEVIQEPGRLGLRIMTPWTWAIAYRRFHQGVLIRQGEARTVGLGTALRLAVNGGVLLAGCVHGDLPGGALAGTALIGGVVAEAGFVHVRVQPVLQRLVEAEPGLTPLTPSGFRRFYVPLALTPLMTLLAEPVGAAAMARMPRALDSLAAWPVVFGLVFQGQALGMAFNEVMVALTGEPGMARALRRFAFGLAVVATAVLAVFAVFPFLARLWMESIAGLAPDLARFSWRALWLTLPIPALTVFHSRYQGLLVHSGRTGGIPESVGLYLLCATLVAFLGVAWGGAAGIFVVCLALGAGCAAQALWLWYRCRGLLQTGEPGGLFTRL